MNSIERRALYNLLRMNWINEPILSVEAWQVEDYRSLTLEALFNRLKSFQIDLDRPSFVAYANECDSPEDFSDHLCADRQFSVAQEDEIFLIVFELWRRLMLEKPSLSIICSELDYQIFLHDQQQLKDPAPLQDALTNFVEILEENVDQGVSTEDVFKLISNYCANDIETFLYDYISEQIDEGNDSYAQELLEDFDIYLRKNKWLKLLRLRLCETSRYHFSHKMIEEIIEEHLDDGDLDYHLEFLSILVEKGNDSILRSLFKQTLPLVKREEEFHDLLSIAMDYFHFFDREQEEMKVKSILEKRKSFDREKDLKPSDPDLIAFTQFLKPKTS